MEVIRFFACALFAVASAASVLASMGVATPPHRMPPGTPLFHTVVFGAYQYGFLLELPRGTRAMSPEMAALHKVLALAGIPMTDMPGMEAVDETEQGPVFAQGGLSPLQDLSIFFALIVFIVMRLPRPARLVLGEVLVPALPTLQWRTPIMLTPPRA